MRRISALAANPIVVALAVALTATACASKKVPNSAADLGLSGTGGYGTGSQRPGSTGDFTVNIGDRIYFDTDSSVIRPDAQATLSKQAQWLNQYPSYSVTVEGHADERGTREYNIALGARRAAAARDFLIARGVAGNRIRTISYGKERPVAACDDISCWTQNRRAVTLLGGQGS